MTIHTKTKPSAPAKLLTMALATCALGCTHEPVPAVEPSENLSFAESNWSAERRIPDPEGISWEVADRFRLFDNADASSRARVEKLLSSLQGVTDFREPEIYSALLETLSGQDTASQLRQSNFDRATWSYNTGYLYPQSYAVRVGARGMSGMCEWSLIEDGSRFRGTEEVSFSRSCEERIEVILPAIRLEGRWGGQGTIRLRTSDGRDLSELIRVDDVLVVALGDSFISGEGNPDVPSDFTRIHDRTAFSEGLKKKDLRTAGWPGSSKVEEFVVKAEWWDEPCHRSLLSWPVITTLSAAAERPRQAMTLLHLGCSGAEVRDGILNAQGEVPGTRKDEGGNWIKSTSQIAEMDALLDPGPQGPARPIDRVLLSAGGNDIGFAGVISFVATPPNGYLWGLGDLFAPWVVAKSQGGGFVRPYDTDRRITRRFGASGDSAQKLLEKLPNEYNDLMMAFVDRAIKPDTIFQTKYPSILERSFPETPPGEPEFLYCRSILSKKDLGDHKNWPEDSDRLRHEEAFRARHLEDPDALEYEERDSGFEALNGVRPGPIRARSDWNFQLVAEPGPAGIAGANCAREETSKLIPDPDESEVCKAQRIHANLNSTITASGKKKSWTIIDEHVRATRPHGWCATKPGERLALPRTGVAWDDQYGWYYWDRFGDEAYDRESPRWFRTPNDSTLFQYGGPDHFMQGTMHPTFNGHLAYANAVVPLAFGVPEAGD